MEINVGQHIYPSFNSTNGIAFEIYLTGCHVHCKGCHNTHLWDKNAGIRMEITDIAKIVKSKKVCDSVAVMGGEPMENKLLPQLLQKLRATGKEIWLYTSYELDQISDEIKDLCDYIKTGKFEIDLFCNGRLHSSNQQIFKKGEDGKYEPYYRVSSMVNV